MKKTPVQYITKGGEREKERERERRRGERRE
jgi:hypothetical protein